MDINKDYKVMENQGLKACIEFCQEERKKDPNLDKAINDCPGDEKDLWEFILKKAKEAAKTNCFCDPTGKKVFSWCVEFFVDYEARKQQEKEQAQKQKEEAKKKAVLEEQEAKKVKTVKEEPKPVVKPIEPVVEKKQPEQLDLFDGFEW